jgi:hypothetical protein
MTRTKTISFLAGEQIVVDLSVEESVRPGACRIRADAGSGCRDDQAGWSRTGRCRVRARLRDARITIAAVKAGAKKGVGIDIDPDRWQSPVA